MGAVNFMWNSFTATVAGWLSSFASTVAFHRVQTHCQRFLPLNSKYGHFSHINHVYEDIVFGFKQPTLVQRIEINQDM